MSVPATAHRKTSDDDHTDKAHSDKNKHMSGHTGTKNATHEKPGTRGHVNTIRKADSIEHKSVHTKSETKRRTSIDAHTKTTHAVAGAHSNETTKSHGATGIHVSHPHTKGQIHTDAHGKTPVHSRSDTHGKSGTRGTVKKSDGHKSRTNKNNKTEHENSDPEKDDLTETNGAVTTTISQKFENISIEKSNDDGSN